MYLIKIQLLRHIHRSWTAVYMFTVLIPDAVFTSKTTLQVNILHSKSYFVKVLSEKSTVTDCTDI